MYWYSRAEGSYELNTINETEVPTYTIVEKQHRIKNVGKNLATK
jgi:hypothetical protein